MSETGVRVCFALLFIFSVAAFFVKIPIQLNLTVFSLTIIYIGAIKSTQFMAKEKIHREDFEAESGIETMGSKEAAKFPIVASAMLFGLYAVIKYVGKWVVNWLLLGYFMIGGVESIKDILEAYATQGVKDWMKASEKKKYLKGVKVKMLDLNFEFSLLDVYCFFVSAAICGLYVYTHHWLTNNIIGILFCIFAI